MARSSQIWTMAGQPDKREVGAGLSTLSKHSGRLAGHDWCHWGAGVVGKISRPRRQNTWARG